MPKDNLKWRSSIRHSLPEDTVAITRESEPENKQPASNPETNNFETNLGVSEPDPTAKSTASLQTVCETTFEATFEVLVIIAGKQPQREIN